MKYFIIAGEASGDLHASNLIKGLQEVDPDSKFLFIGGDLMSVASNTEPFQHYKEMNFMGLFAVLRNLGRLRAIMKNAKQKIISENPDALILVDYAGFNLRMAKFAYNNGIKVYYYISPKVWAWRKSRIKSLKKYVNRLFVIFPFEIDYFKSNNLEVEFLGNPLMDQLEEFRKVKSDKNAFLTANKLDERPIVALLAGSRKQEISESLPEMIEASREFSEHQFVIAGAPSVNKELYDSLIAGSDIKVIYDDTYNLLNNSEAAVVTSGTATLETALLNVPQVVVYKTAAFTYRLGSLFVNIRFFSLVNLIFGEELVKEILQFNLAEGIKLELRKILFQDEYKLRIEEGYATIKELIGGPGASRRVALRIKELIT